MQQPPPIACTLERDALRSRLDDWQALLARVASRKPVGGGMRLTFEAGAPADEIARLAEAEHACCPFLAFTITVDHRGVALEVVAPPEAEPIIAALFGSDPLATNVDLVPPGGTTSTNVGEDGAAEREWR